MIDERIYEQFKQIGRDLYTAGMISSHGGNLSMRVGDRVVIKRRGAQLGLQYDALAGPGPAHWSASGRRPG